MVTQGEARGARALETSERPRWICNAGPPVKRVASLPAPLGRVRLLLGV